MTDLTSYCPSCKYNVIFKPATRAHPSGEMVYKMQCTECGLNCGGKRVRGPTATPASKKARAGKNTRGQPPMGTGVFTPTMQETFPPGTKNKTNVELRALIASQDRTIKSFRGMIEATNAQNDTLTKMVDMLKKQNAALIKQTQETEKRFIAYKWLVDKAEESQRERDEIWFQMVMDGKTAPPRRNTDELPQDNRPGESSMQDNQHDRLVIEGSYTTNYADLEYPSTNIIDYAFYDMLTESLFDDPSV